MFTIPKWIVYGIVLPTLFLAIYRQFVQQFRQERSSLRHYPIALLICLGCHPKNDHPGLQSCISLEKTQDTKKRCIAFACIPIYTIILLFIPQPWQTGLLAPWLSSSDRPWCPCPQLGAVRAIFQRSNRPGKLVDHMALVKSRGHPQIIHFMFGFPFETVQLLGFLYFLRNL